MEEKESHAPGATDYGTDVIPSFNMELKGNSAEGNVYDRAMEGFGGTAAPGRNVRNTGNDAPGAFIKGSNKGNNVQAGSPMSGAEGSAV
jgi:hypothetical protein